MSGNNWNKEPCGRYPIMDDLGKLLARAVLDRIKEIEEESNLDYLIDSTEVEISNEAKLIKDKMNSIKKALESI